MIRSIAFATAFIATVPNGTQTESEPNLCAAAQRLLSAHELSNAHTAFHNILRKTNTTTCAQAGLREVARLRGETAHYLALARDARQLKDREVAQKQFLSALEIDRSNEEARRGLSAAAPPPQSSPMKAFGHAEGLWKAGYVSEARVATRAALKQHSVTGLEDYLRVPKWEQTVNGAAYSLTAFAKAGAVFAAFLAAIVVLLVSTRKFYRTYFAKPRAIELCFGRFSDPNDRIEVGKTLKAALSAELAHASEAPTRLSDVSGPGATMPAPVELPTEVQFLKSLWAWAVRPTTYVVHATATSGIRGGTIFVTIQDPQKQFVARRLFETQVSTEVDRASYLELVNSIGAWMVFEVQKLLNPNGPDPTVHGTKKWRSYEFVRRAETSTEDKKERYLRDAIAYDPLNVAALVMLGRIESERFEDSDSMAAGISRLEIARRLMKGDRPPLWFQAMYGVAVAYLHRFAKNEPELQGLESADLAQHEAKRDLDNGNNVALELAVEIGETMMGPCSKLKARKIPRVVDSSLRQMLTQEWRENIGVLAGSMASLEALRSAASKDEGRSPTVPLPWRSDKAKWAWLASLNTTNPTSADLAAVLEDGEDDGRYYHNYNLACYNARAQNFDKAYTELTRTREKVSSQSRPFFLAYVWRDPTLSLLREKDEERFSIAVGGAKP